MSPAAGLGVAGCFGALPCRLRVLSHRVGATRNEGVQMGYVIDCVDGMQVRGETMDELRRNAEQHVAEYHAGEDLDFEAVMASARAE
jgi:tRNA A37 threonylcarbamoyladenosine dehydratase